MTALSHWAAAAAVVRYRKRAVLRMVCVAAALGLWILFGTLWATSAYRDIQAESRKVRMEVMVAPDSPDSVARSIAATIEALPSVAAVRLVHELEVWREFTEEVGVEDDLRAVVRMPRIIRVTFHPEAVTTLRLSLLASALALNHAEHCSEVVWPRQWVYNLDARRRDLIILGTVAGVLSALLYIGGLGFAFRSELHQAAPDLQYAALLGGTPHWIAMPHIIVGVIAGTAGVLVACGALLLVWYTFASQVQWLMRATVADVLLTSIALTVGVGILSYLQALAAARAATNVRKIP